MAIKRVILDTNIYDHVIANPEDREALRRKLQGYELVIYGIKNLIRAELRTTSRKVKVEGRSLRILLLNWYDLLVEDHEIAVTPKTRKLAREYFAEYRGISGWKGLGNDFTIVAAATLDELDIVVSEDERTMCSDYALEAYRRVNRKNRLETPEFIGYKKFRRLFNP